MPINERTNNKPKIRYLPLVEILLLVSPKYSSVEEIFLTKLKFETSFLRDALTFLIEMFNSHF